MRLWSLHPKYLDAKGLVALWREALLAQKVLRAGTKGYRHHPQLVRFRQQPDPLAAIAVYLRAVSEDAKRRGYSFDSRKINGKRWATTIPVTRGQTDFESRHLKRKLRTRDRAMHRTLCLEKELLLHPLFRAVEGRIETWEKGQTGK